MTGKFGFICCLDGLQKQLVALFFDLASTLKYLYTYFALPDMLLSSTSRFLVFL
jgi:hypothetical protein